MHSSIDRVYLRKGVVRHEEVTTRFIQREGCGHHVINESLNILLIPTKRNIHDFFFLLLYVFFGSTYPPVNVKSKLAIVKDEDLFA